MAESETQIGDRRGAPRGDQSRPLGHRRDGTPHEGMAGNLPFVPTDAQRDLVKQWGVLLTREQLALKMGISVDTLRRYFPDELARATADMTAIIGSKLVKQALDGCKTSQIFFLKTKGGWNQRTELELAAQKGAVFLDLSLLTEDQIRAAIPVFEALITAGAGRAESGGESG